MDSTVALAAAAVALILILLLLNLLKNQIGTGKLNCEFQLQMLQLKCMDYFSQKMWRNPCKKKLLQLSEEQ